MVGRPLKPKKFGGKIFKTHVVEKILEKAVEFSIV